MLEAFHADRARQLFDSYAQLGVWHCPTLSTSRSDVVRHDSNGAARDPNFRLLPVTFVPTLPFVMFKDEALDKAFHQKRLEVTGMMYRAGVKLLAGTDTGVPFVLPSFGLHDELELMVSAGIPDSAVLRLATLGAAQFLERENELGSVRSGKLADLVLFDADPLQSIANTGHVRAVIADGRLYEGNALGQLRSPAVKPRN